MRRFVSQWVVFALLVSCSMGAAWAQSQVMTTEGGQTTDGGSSVNCSEYGLGSGMCMFPMCWEAAIEYDPATLALTSVDLHEPDDPKKGDADVWTSFQGADIDTGIAQAALNNLRQSLTPKAFNQPCVEPACDCTMPPAAPNWGPWQQTTIDSQLDIPNPRPRDPKVNGKLYYTAHATVNVRGKAKVGHCDKVEVQE